MNPLLLCKQCGSHTHLLWMRPTVQKVRGHNVKVVITVPPSGWPAPNFVRFFPGSCPNLPTTFHWNHRDNFKVILLTDGQAGRQTWPETHNLLHIHQELAKCSFNRTATLLFYCTFRLNQNILKYLLNHSCIQMIIAILCFFIYFVWFRFQRV